jgi:hypothetical protein
MWPSACDKPLKLPGRLRPKETSAMDQCRLRVRCGIGSALSRKSRYRIWKLPCRTWDREKTKTSGIDPSLPCGWGTSRKSFPYCQAFDCSNLRRASVSLALNPLIYFMLAPVNSLASGEYGALRAWNSPTKAASI